MFGHSNNFFPGHTVSNFNLAKELALLGSGGVGGWGGAKKLQTEDTIGLFFIITLIVVKLITASQKSRSNR